MSVVQVVWRANRNVIEGSRRGALEAVCMLLKTLEFGKKFALRGDAINDADRIIDVIGGDQNVTGVLDGTHVARSDVTGSADQGKILHEIPSCLSSKPSKGRCWTLSV